MCSRAGVQETIGNSQSMLLIPDKRCLDGTTNSCILVPCFSAGCKMLSAYLLTTFPMHGASADTCFCCKDFGLMVADTYLCWAL